MPPNPPPITDAEWRIMQHLWERSPQTAADLTAMLADDANWSSSTVKTLLGRLVKKGVLKTKADGKRFLYRPAVRRDRCVRTESHTFLDRVFGGNAGPAAAHFIKHHRLTSEQLDELRKLLDDKTA